MLMMENTWYSVISPEGCASILFRDAKRAEDAAEALKPIPTDLEEMGICERIIEEPNGGAHRDFESSADFLKKALIEEIELLSKVKPEEFLENRIKKYDALGYFKEVNVETIPVPGTDDQIDIVYSVEEETTGSLGGNIGYSDFGLMLGFNLQEQNFLVIITAWGLSTLLTNRYKEPNSINHYYEIAPYIKASILTFLFLTFFYYSLRIDSESIQLI